MNTMEPITQTSHTKATPKLMWGVLATSALALVVLGVLGYMYGPSLMKTLTPLETNMEIKALPGIVSAVREDGFELKPFNDRAYGKNLSVRIVNVNAETEFKKRGARKDEATYQKETAEFTGIVAKAEQGDAKSQAYIETHQAPGLYVYTTASLTDINVGDQVVVLPGKDVRSELSFYAKSVLIEALRETAPQAGTPEARTKTQTQTAAVGDTSAGLSAPTQSSIPAGFLHSGYVSWSGNWNANEFWCSANYFPYGYHLDETSSNNATWVACVGFDDPDATLVADNTSLYPGESVTLTWSSANATSCLFDQDKVVTNGATSGSATITPTGTDEYTVRCYNGSSAIPAVDSVTVTVAASQPTQTFTASPTSIISGNPSVLSWTTSNTNSCNIDNGVGTVQLSGSTTVYPAVTTTYTLTCSLNRPDGSPDTTGAQVTRTATVTVTSAPDLVAGTASPSSATAGTAVSISAPVTNNGSATTGTSFTNLFQFDADADHTTVTATQTDTSPALAVGATDITTVSRTFATTGTWYVRVCADNNASMVGTKTEGNESNNCSAWTTITVGAAPGPNLTAGSVTPATAALGTPVTLSSTITNSGNTTTGTASFTNVFQTATSAAGAGASVVGTATRAALASGTSGATTFSYSFPSAGTWYVRACADNDASFVGTVTETDEADNCGAWTAVTVTVPNLTAGIITPATSAVAGTPVTLSSTVSNTGTGSTGTTFTDVFQTATSAAGAGATVIGTYSNPTLSAGTGVAASLSYSFPSAGTWYVRACADNNASFVGTITESNESDNCGAWTAVTVAAPNLTAGAVTPTSAVVNVAVTLSSTVSNTGNASTGTTFTDVFQVANDASGSGAVVAGTVTNVTRTAGTSGAVSLSYTFTTSGTKYVRACADNNASMVGSIVESNEADNCSTWTAVTVAGPNLIVGTVTPTTATMGTAVTLSATVTNNGGATTGTTFTDIFQVADDASGTGATVIGTYTNPIRTAGSAGNATLSYTFTSGGAKYARVCADQNASFVGTINETNETDNCGVWTAITVNGPNLTAGNVTPTSAVAGTPVTFTSTITNSGTVSTGAAFTDLFQVAYDASGTGASDIGTFANPVRTAGTNNVATVSYTFATPGTKYVRACADKASAAGTGTINETSESDNCSAWTAVVVTSPPTGPNLTSGSVTPTTAVAGTAVTVSATVSNIGTASTGTGFTNLFQFDNDSDHSTVAATQTDTSPVIAAGNSDVTSVSRTFATGGTWYVRVCADNDNAFNGVIIEMSETDNCSAWTSVNVSGATGTNLTVAPLSSVSATVGIPATVTLQVTNSGTISTGAGFTNLFQFDNNVDHTTITTSLTDASPTLGSGISDMSSVSMNFPTAGVWYVRGCADNNASFVGTIVETNESDNCAAWIPVNVASATAGANLTAGAVSPTTAVAGTATTLSAVVTNSGTESTVYGFTNYFYIERVSDRVTVSITDTSPVLAAGASDMTSASYTFPSVGTYTVRVCPDNSMAFAGVITESNEDDNCSAATSVTVTAAAGPNLTTGAVTPITATAGTAVSLRATITNSGSASTVTSFVNVYQTATDAVGTGATAIGTYTSAARTAGSSVSALLSYTFGTPGTYYVRVCADNNASFVGTIAESDEGDNCGPWTAVSVGGVGATADLVAGAVTPLVATAGVPVTFSSTITNSGSGSTGTGFTTLFQFDADVDHVNNGVTSTQTDAVSALAPSGSEVSTVSQTFAAASTWYVRTCTDNDASFVGAITESNEANNCSSWRTVTVSAPTGAGVTSCTVSPGSVATGTPVTWTASPSGLGTYTWTPSEGGAAGGTGVSLNRTYNTAGTYGMSVTAGGGTANCPNVIVGASQFGTAEPTITTSPERVVPGGTTQITVSATGVDSSCTLTGPGVSRDFTPVAGVVSATTVNTLAINNQSTYTFTCDDVEATAKAIVNIIPVIQEF
jgi:hypothetical protein